LNRKIICLFARKSSTRLPGKALLKLNTKPVLAICAERLSGAGWDLVVATSATKSDDEIATTCAKYGISCFRGSLRSPLNRLKALLDSRSYDVIVRATADNIVPDNLMANHLFQTMVERRSEFCYISGAVKGVPKGVSLDIFTSQFFYEQFAKQMLSHEHIVGNLRETLPDSATNLGISVEGETSITIDSEADFEVINACWKTEMIKLDYRALAYKLARKIQYIDRSR